MNHVKEKNRHRENGGSFFGYLNEVKHGNSHPVVVELEKAETTSTSTNIRTTASSPLRYLSPVIRF